MTLIKREDIVTLFDKINKSNINYVLLRNINRELPASLKRSKDIDLLVDKRDKIHLFDLLNENGYKVIDHPFHADTFLYCADHFEFRYNQETGIILDICYQLVCRSLDAGQWIPLDKSIQDSAWYNKRFVKGEGNFCYWTLDYDDEYITLITRSVFDKKEFQPGYISRIEEISPMINHDKVVIKLESIFFKFNTSLLGLLEQKAYGNILNAYIKFAEY